jgi:hypothetical protein
MITIVFPHKTYSDNKLKIKRIIKKYGMSWDDRKSGWVNEATGDGVYIDRSVIEMIMEDTFTENQPMTLFVESRDEAFLKELEAMCEELGGQFILGGATPVRAPAHEAKKAVASPVTHKDIFMRLNIRDASGCATPEFREKAYEDLKDISGRWERRKRQLLIEYKKMGLKKDVIDSMLHREEIAFRKSNACWVTGEFPADGGQNA